MLPHKSSVFLRQSHFATHHFKLISSIRYSFRWHHEQAIFRITREEGDIAAEVATKG